MNCVLKIYTKKKKKKRKWTHNSLCIEFHFFIKPNETACDCCFSNSVWSPWKKISVVLMIKNISYYVHYYSIKQQWMIFQKTIFTTPNLANKLYLFSNKSASKNISVDMNLIFPGVHGFILSQLFHFLLINKSFYYNNSPCLTPL